MTKKTTKKTRAISGATTKLVGDRRIVKHRWACFARNRPDERHEIEAEDWYHARELAAVHFGCETGDVVVVLKERGQPCGERHRTT